MGGVPKEEGGRLHTSQSKAPGMEWLQRFPRVYPLLLMSFLKAQQGLGWRKSCLVPSAGGPRGLRRPKCWWLLRLAGGGCGPRQDAPHCILSGCS